MDSKLDCVRQILERYRCVVVKKSEDSLTCEYVKAFPNNVTLFIDFEYTLENGLRIERIGESKNGNNLPTYVSYETYKNDKEKYAKYGYVEGLKQNIEEAIKNECKQWEQ